MPTTSSAAVRITVIRVITDHVSGAATPRASSKTTGKPSPPMITATATVRLIHGSPT